MFPQHLLSLFPPFPRKPQVFVAMSFAPEYQARWEKVIKPAIESVGLSALRVDAREISDCVITDIVRGIADSELILADITARNDGVRNANVMYEVGLAHAVRQPEETILIRSDKLNLLFDTATVRTHCIDFEDNDSAISRVAHLLEQSRRAVCQQKSLAIQTAALRCGNAELTELIAAVQSKCETKSPESLGEAIGAIYRQVSIGHLLEIGAIAPRFMKDLNLQDSMIVGYTITEFGRVLLENLLDGFLGSVGKTWDEVMAWRDAQHESALHNKNE